MFRVSKEIDFCYGHRLLRYEGKCRHLHGHNGRAVIVLEGESLDERGMLVDFADIGYQPDTQDIFLGAGRFTTPSNGRA